MESFKIIFESWGGDLAIVFVFALAISKFIKSAANDYGKYANIEIKEKACSFILLNNKEFRESVVQNFNAISNRFFGEKRFTLKCFFRSSLISIFCFISLVFYFRDSLFLEQIELGYKVILFIISIALINVFMDFVSLLITREILSKKTNLIAKLILDLFLSYSWFVLVFSYYGFFLVMNLSIEVAEGVYFSPDNTVSSYITTQVVSEGISFEKATFETVALLTTFSTSVWLWLHVLGQFTLYWLKATSKLARYYNIEEFPIESIGRVASIWVWVLAAVWMLYISIT